ncbi:MAG: hypothetical protein ACRD51_00035, partial [Candidatus Acidiferrum sp.]
LAVCFILLVLAIAPRLNEYLMARKFQAVLAGLQNVRVDETTEEDLERSVPYLKLVGNGSDYGLPRERWYAVEFTNEPSYLRFLRFFSDHQWLPKSSALRWADWLGFHYMSLDAGAVLLDGKVSSVNYAVASEDTAPRVLGNIVSIRSAHGYWLEHRLPVWVSSAEDQSPDYRIKETTRRPSGGKTIESSLEISYSLDAPPTGIEHAFQADLGCFWSYRGCRNGREILPLVWQDRNSINAAALARLESANPCPDSVLEGRVRSLPDVDVYLAAVFNSRAGWNEGADGELYWTPTSEYYYRVLEVLVGEFEPRRDRPFLHTFKIASPVNPKQELSDPSVAEVQASERMILFGNDEFESCSIVPATDSAEAAVRAAVLPAKRREDQIVTGLM